RQHADPVVANVLRRQVACGVENEANAHGSPLLYADAPASAAPIAPRSRRVSRGAWLPARALPFPPVVDRLRSAAANRAGPRCTRTDGPILHSCAPAPIPGQPPDAAPGSRP